MVVLLTHGEHGFSSMGSWCYCRKVGAILGNGYGIQGQNYVAFLQESGMPGGFLFRNLILGICFRLLILNIFQRCND